MFDQRANRAYYLERGKCPRCGGKHPLIPGMKRCAVCSEKERQQVKDRTRRRIEAGLCVRCGKRPAPDGFRMCEQCRKDDKVFRVYDPVKAKRRRDKLKERGICINCASAPAVGQHVRCEKCREKQRKRKGAANENQTG